MKEKLVRFFDYIGSRRFAIILLIITTVVILAANLIPNPILMSPENADFFVRERPVLYRVSKMFHVMNITKSPFFLVIPSFIFLSVTVCTYKRIRHIGRGPFALVEGFKVVGSGRGIGEDNAIATLERRGWRVARSGGKEGAFLTCRKGEKGIWGSIVFHIGMEIIIIGAIVSMLTAYRGTLLLTEGFGVEPKGSLGLKDGDGFPFRQAELESFDAVYREGEFPVDYTAKINTVDRSGKEGIRIVKVNKPIKVGGYQLVLVKYSFSPRFVITERESGRLIEDAFINLVITGADQTDNFDLEKAGIRIKARFFPDFQQDGNKLKTLSMETKNPVFLLEFEKGGKKIGSGILPMGKRMDIDEGRYTMEFRDLRHWITISVTRDYGMPLILTGFFMIVSGLVARFAMNERRVWVAFRGERVDIGGRATYFPALFEAELKEICNELGFTEV